jgi:hypothetical protein
VRLTGQATVVLVADLARSVAYYRDAVGFETRPWEVNPEHSLPPPAAVRSEQSDPGSRAAERG